MPRTTTATRTPRELRYWDHANNGPVPESYWEQRRQAAKVMEAHRQEVDNTIMWSVLAFVGLLAVGTVVMQLLGIGPIR